MVAIPLGRRLQATHVTACKRFGDCKTNELLSRQHFRYNLSLKLRRTVIEYWRQSDDVTGEEAVNIRTGPKTSNFEVDDELDKHEHSYMHDRIPTYFMEVVIALRSNDPAHKRLALEMLAFA